jgi:hypothetical protein
LEQGIIQKAIDSRYKKYMSGLAGKEDKDKTGGQFTDP